MNCSFCNSKIDDNVSYCPKCGHIVENHENKDIVRERRINKNKGIILVGIGIIFVIAIIIASRGERTIKERDTDGIKADILGNESYFLGNIPEDITVEITQRETSQKEGYDYISCEVIAEYNEYTYGFDARLNYYKQDKLWVVNGYTSSDYVITPKERITDEEIMDLFKTEDVWVSRMIRDDVNNTCEEIIQLEISERLPYGTKMTIDEIRFVFAPHSGWVLDESYRSDNKRSYCELNAESLIGAWHFKNDFLNTAAYLNIYNIETIGEGMIQLTGELLCAYSSKHTAQNFCLELVDYQSPCYQYGFTSYGFYHEVTIDPIKGVIIDEYDCEFEPDSFFDLSKYF